MVDDGRTTTDGRTTEHGYTISSPCEPDGSGELISTVGCLVGSEYFELVRHVGNCKHHYIPKLSLVRAGGINFQVFKRYTH